MATKRETVTTSSIRPGMKVLAGVTTGQTMDDPARVYPVHTLSGTTVATVREVIPGRMGRRLAYRVVTDKGESRHIYGVQTWAIALASDIEAALTSETGHIRPVKSDHGARTLKTAGPDAKLSPGMVACMWRAAGVETWAHESKPAALLPKSLRHQPQTSNQWAALVTRGLVTPWDAAHDNRHQLTGAGRLWIEAELVRELDRALDLAKHSATIVYDYTEPGASVESREKSPVDGVPYQLDRAATHGQRAALVRAVPASSDPQDRVTASVAKVLKAEAAEAVAAASGAVTSARMLEQAAEAGHVIAAAAELHAVVTGVTYPLVHVPAAMLAATVPPGSSADDLIREVRRQLVEEYDAATARAWTEKAMAMSERGALLHLVRRSVTVLS